MKNLLLATCLVLLTSATIQIGDHLSSPKNQFTVSGCLKEGAFAEVFEVKDSNQEIYALKSYKSINPPHKSPFSYFFGDPEREYQVGATLNHPSIVRAIEQWDSFLVLERAHGKPLCQFRKNSFQEEEAVFVCLQLIDAMKHAFCNRYSHINLQSQNVIISEDLQVKLVDLAYFVSFQDLKKHFKMEGSDAELNAIWLKHFNGLADLCIEVFGLTPFSREARIEKKWAIKQVVFELIEDFEEKQDIHFEDRMDALRNVIRSFLV